MSRRVLEATSVLLAAVPLAVLSLAIGSSTGLEKALAAGLALSTVLHGFALARCASHDREVREQKRRADRATRSKDAFLANVSHEVRTPMAAIVGYSGLLERPNASQADREVWVHELRRNADHLLTLVDDLLDLSRIEAGQLEITRSSTSVADIVDHVTDLVRARAQEKVLDLEIGYETPVPVSAQTDPVRLRQVLTHLLGNAVKYTDEGGIRVLVRAHRPEADGGAGRLEIAVEDTGVGISADRLDSAFEPFQRLHDSDPRRGRSTGLGLDVARHLARLLGGDLTVESEVGQGSRFTLTLELVLDEGAEWIEVAERDPETEAAPEPAAAAVDLDGVRVLLVEDGPDNQRIISYLLEDRGVHVVIADDGRAGVERALAARDAGEPFDLILMDMQMPVMDGYTATAKLREEGFELPIIALTAYTMAGDEKKCLDAGCSSYASKPILPAALFERVNGSLGERPTERAPRSESPKPRASSFVLAQDPGFAPILKQYLDAMPATARAIEEAWSTKDLAQVTTRVHQIAGSAASFGFAELSTLARDCEDRIRRGADEGEVHAALTAVLDHMGALVDENADFQPPVADAG